jgi:hypothetical protein
MKGNAEFLVLFVPFLIVAILTIYGAWFYPLTDILINPILVFVTQILLTLIGIFCIIVDVFALMVQYVNWKYYNEE